MVCLLAPHSFYGLVEKPDDCRAIPKSIKVLPRRLNHDMTLIDMRFRINETEREYQSSKYLDGLKLIEACRPLLDILSLLRTGMTQNMKVWVAELAFPVFCRLNQGNLMFWLEIVL
jgi:hypothetical protein